MKSFILFIIAFGLTSSGSSQADSIKTEIYTIDQLDNTKRFQEELTLAIQKCIDYSEFSLIDNNQICSKLLFSCFIESVGKISQITFLNSCANVELKEEIIRQLQLCTFPIGIKDKKPIQTKVILPINIHWN